MPTAYSGRTFFRPLTVSDIIAAVASSLRIDQIVDALGDIPYPGYDRDIVSLGLVEDVSPEPGGGVSIVLRQATENDEIMRQVAAQIHHVLGHELGVDKIALKVRRLEAELGEKTGRLRLAGVRHIVAVASGKGGVGKSTVSANLAVALSRLGYRVGLFDADIYGPSIGLMFGAQGERPAAAGRERFFPIERHGIKLISMAFFLTDSAPVIWRGPMVMSAVRQLLQETQWGELDFLLVDLPPGTGDAQLTLTQLVALDGAVIVTTPQDVAVLDAQRAARMFHQVHCQVLGVIENMSVFVCPDCGEAEEIFGHGGGERIAREEGARLLGRLPLYPEIREDADAGMPIVLARGKHPASKAFIEVARQLAEVVPQ